MKILITGTSGIGLALYEKYKEDNHVVMVSRKTGNDIKNVETWGHEFLDYDVVFNNAYQDFAQVSVLEFFFKHWKDDPSKVIVNIGSRSSYYTQKHHPTYWGYSLHKQALQIAHDSMLTEAVCDIKIINPGPVDTDMVAGNPGPKFSKEEIANRIRMYAEDPAIKRVDLWI